MKRAMLLCLLAVPAWGGDAALTWTTPTGNCNNTPLTDLAGYRVRWGNGSTELPATANSFNVVGLTPGKWWVNVAAFNAAGAESQYVAGWKEVLPGEFVTKTSKVYTFFRTGGNIVLTVTPHTVGVGVTCDATQSVNGKYRVPLEAVTWNGSKLTAALADCG